MVTLAGFIFNSPYILGVFFPDIAGLSLMPWLAFVLLIISIRNPSLKLKHLLALLLAVFIYFIGLFLSDWGSYSTYKTQMLMLKAFPLMLIPFILKDKIYLFLAGYAIPIAIFLMIAFIASISMVGVININDRLEIGVFNPIWISRASLELILLCIIVFSMKRSFLLCLLFLVIPVIYTAGSKGPIISFIFTIILWFLNERCHNRTQRVRFVLSLTLLLIGLALLISVIGDDSYFYQRFLLQVPDGTQLLDESRGVVWPLVIDKIVSQDIMHTLVGHGVGEYENFFYGSSTGARYYPHNIFLELIVENGIIATIFIFVAFVYVYRSSVSSIRYLLLFAFINAQFSGDIILNELLFFYGGALLVSMRVKTNKRFGGAYLSAGR